MTNSSSTICCMPFTKGCVAPMKGRKHSISTRQKMRLAKLGTVPWNKGKHLSDEIRKKMSNARKGRKLSVETKQKMSKAHLGKLGVAKRWANNKKTHAKAKAKIRRYPTSENHTAYVREWRARNRLQDRFAKMKYKTRKRGAEGSHSLSQWEDLKMLCNYMCLCCKKYEPDIILTEDHIIPLSKGGTDYIDNIQPLCRSCNSRKSVKDFDYRYSQEPITGSQPISC